MDTFRSTLDKKVLYIFWPIFVNPKTCFSVNKVLIGRERGERAALTALLSQRGNARMQTKTFLAIPISIHLIKGEKKYFGKFLRIYKNLIV